MFSSVFTCFWNILLICGLGPWLSIFSDFIGILKPTCHKNTEIHHFMCFSAPKRRARARVRTCIPLGIHVLLVVVLQIVRQTEKRRASGGGGEPASRYREHLRTSSTTYWSTSSTTSCTTNSPARACSSAARVAAPRGQVLLACACYHLQHGSSSRSLQLVPAASPGLQVKLRLSYSCCPVRRARGTSARPGAG